MAEKLDETGGLIQFPQALRDELLYLIVFGPGYGESIIIRVPPDQWLVVDSLTIEPKASSPAVSMMRKHGTRWTGVILTHPHEDHAAGLSAVLESAGGGPIGCVAPYVEPPAEWMTTDDPETHLRRGAVEDALAAIQYRWEREGGARWELVSGDERTFGDARVHVLHPSANDVKEAMTSPPPDDPNALASPLLIEWRDVRLVLGSDLPKRGWRAVHQRSAALDLGRHHGFKVSHHGSKGALHDVVLTSANRNRLWVVSPFQRGRGLPCFDEGHGVAGLLDHNDELVLTSLRDVSGSGVRPWRLTRQEVCDARAKAGAKSPLGKDVRSVPRQGMDPAGWFAVGFDGTGSIVDRQYGEGAVLIVDAPTAQAQAKPVTKGKARRHPRPART